MSLHASPSRKAQLKRIERDQRTERPPTSEQVAAAYLKAQLYYAATVLQDPEAREQLRLLASITEASQLAYLVDVIVEFEEETDDLIQCTRRVQS